MRDGERARCTAVAEVDAAPCSVCCARPERGGDEARAAALSIWSARSRFSRRARSSCSSCCSWRRDSAFIRVVRARISARRRSSSAWSSASRLAASRRACSMAAAAARAASAAAPVGAIRGRGRRVGPEAGLAAAAPAEGGRPPWAGPTRCGEGRRKERSRRSSADSRRSCSSNEASSCRISIGDCDRELRSRLEARDRPSRWDGAARSVEERRGAVAWGYTGGVMMVRPRTGDPFRPREWRPGTDGLCLSVSEGPRDGEGERREKWAPVASWE
jgi:hypothetical protein